MALSSVKIASPYYNVTDKDWKNIFSFHKIRTDQCRDTVMACADGPYLTAQRVVKNNPCNSVFGMFCRYSSLLLSDIVGCKSIKTHPENIIDTIFILP